MSTSPVLPTNTKAAAWDFIGSLFWEAGRVSARPSDDELEMFTADVDAGSRVVVVGASTKTLVEVLAERGARVTVLDFSTRMVDDLRAALPAGTATVVQHDITTPAPPDLAGTQDFVVSDRLVNRFAGREVVDGLTGMLGLLRGGGIMRTSVKLGLYPMDERMIALGRERGVLDTFFDETEQTIDFPAAGDVLPDALVDHGTIPREALLQWYRGRGREQRFDDAGLRAALAAAEVDTRHYEQVDAVPLPDAPTTRLYRARASDGV